MKKLILMRHSDAETGSFDSTDFNRRLTDKGKNKTNIQANRLKKIQIVPDLIISSTAVRALETAQITSSILSPNCIIQQVPLLYDDFTTSVFFDLLSNIDNSIDTLILVGHNPTISVMASRLDLKVKISFAPCSIGIFSFSSDWNLAETGCGKLIEFIA